MSKRKPFTVRTGEDSFGTFIELEDFNEYDELEDLLVEAYGLVPMAVQHSDQSERGTFLIWLDKSVDVDSIEKIISLINNNRA